MPNWNLIGFSEILGESSVLMHTGNSESLKTEGGSNGMESRGKRRRGQSPENDVEIKRKLYWKKADTNYTLQAKKHVALLNKSLSFPGYYTRQVFLSFFSQLGPYIEIFS